jgi:hypothetical protein
MGEPHEAEPGHHRREHQRPTVPLLPGLRIRDPAQLAEVDLQLIPRRTVVDPHRRPSDRSANPELFEGVAMQRPRRHHHTSPLEQLMGLHHRQALVLQPLLELVPVRIEQPAGLAPAVGPMRPHPLNHLTDQHIGQLVLVAGPVQAELLGGLHVAADRLAVHPRQPADRPQPLTTQPQPQHLSHFEHANLPERHAASSGSRRQRRRQAERPRHRTWRTPQGGPITGERVVPSLATRRSHPTGETHAQVVPSHWRATRAKHAVTPTERSWRPPPPPPASQRLRRHRPTMTPSAETRPSATTPMVCIGHPAPTRPSSPSPSATPPSTPADARPLHRQRPSPATAR